MAPVEQQLRVINMANVESLAVPSAVEARIAPSRYYRSTILIGRLLGLVLLILATPVLLILMAIVKISSRGPAIYSQTRVGLHGKQYRIYKLRTMRVDAEKGHRPRLGSAQRPASHPGRAMAPQVASG
ncbi:MAG: hypothetical protein KatS3mg105_5196 [Gemmatales bacterium]|nr:MAG: hypothetical protein KatS3mg105_5196 [Gemmatales bacterium]